MRTEITGTSTDDHPLIKTLLSFPDAPCFPWYHNRNPCFFAETLPPPSPIHDAISSGSASNRSKSCIYHLQSPFCNRIDPIHHERISAQHRDLSLFFVYNLQDLPSRNHDFANTPALESDEEPDDLLMVRLVYSGDASHEQGEYHEFSLDESMAGDFEAKLQDSGDALRQFLRRLWCTVEALVGPHAGMGVDDTRVVQGISLKHRRLEIPCKVRTCMDLLDDRHGGRR